MSCRDARHGNRTYLTSKSFLVLFFKKQLLPFFFSGRAPQTGMRVTEILLLSLPAILLALWFAGLRHASMRSFMIAALLLAALGGALMWFGEQRTFTGRYHPAHLQNGQVVP
jgi:undecaprenyl pyrophosphate phosphatase UppP